MSTVNMSGRFSLELRGPDGEIKDKREGDNLIVTLGLNELAAISIGASGFRRPGQLKIGSSTSAVTATQQALGSQLAAATATDVSRSSAQASWAAFFATGEGTGTVEEVAAFATATGGTDLMFARFLTGGVSKGANDTLTVTWNLTFAT